MVNTKNDFMKRMSLIVMIMLFGHMMASAQEEEQEYAVDVHGQLSVSGTHIVDKNGEPVQLQGMSLFWSNWSTPGGIEGNFYTYEAVEETRDYWCANIVRAAMGIEPDGAYLDNPEAQKAKVETIIEAAIDLGIYVIIDWHDHTAHEHEEEAAAFFVEMAQKYGDYPNIIYEIYNEPDYRCEIDPGNDPCPSDERSYYDWGTNIKPYSEVVIDSIRKYDENNIIVCGTPRWSQDVDVASENPIDGENIAYTLHYYAGSHKQWLRDRAITAMENGVALFVTEYGTVDASGDGDVDEEESQLWFDFMEEHKISHCNWSLHDKDEGASALKPGTSNQGGWTDEDLTASGLFVRDYLVENCPEYHTIPEPPTTSTASKEEDFTQIYPNPFSSKLFIEGVEGQWQLYNISGLLIKEGDEQVINTSQLEKGIYILSVGHKTYKVVKE